MIKPKFSEKEKSLRDVKEEEETKEIEEKILPEVEKEEVWQPKTELGQLVAKGEISSLKEVFDKNHKIFETEIVDKLLPEAETELLLIGQARGKFGGGQRRVFRQTQKKTAEGNKIQFICYAAIGNKDGYLGVGKGKAKETVPAREKAIREAKLNLFRVRRGCGSWQCNCRQPHSIPFVVEGKSSSCRIKLIPAPKGKGLVVEKEAAKILRLAGIQDIWSKTFGKGNKSNLILALLNALSKLSEMKVREEEIEKLGIVEGKKE